MHVRNPLAFSRHVQLLDDLIANGFHLRQHSGTVFAAVGMPQDDGPVSARPCSRCEGFPWNSTSPRELIHYQVEQRQGQWRLQFDLDMAAWNRLLGHRLRRIVLLTNRMDWSA